MRRGVLMSAMVAIVLPFTLNVPNARAVSAVDLYCLGLKVNPNYWNAWAAVKIAIETDLINTREECNDAANIVGDFGIPTGSFATCICGSIDFPAEPGITWMPDGLVSTSIFRYAAGDLNGDGRDDIASFRAPMPGSANLAGAAMSSSTSFQLDVRQLGGFFGARDTLLGDVNGDGRDDGVAVNHDNVMVTLSNGTTFSAAQVWFSQSFYGRHGTFVADVDGDGRDDMVGVGDNYIGVLRSTGSSFGPYETWKGSFPFHGSRGTFIVDVDGDGRADAVGVGEDYIGVMRSTGSSFGSYETWKGSFPFYGSRGTFIVDVDGDGRADAVGVSEDYIGVMRSTGSSFGSYETWKAGFPFYGSRATGFADVDGDGRADAFGIGDGYVGVMRSTGNAFGGYETWFAGPL